MILKVSSNQNNSVMSQWSWLWLKSWVCSFFFLWLICQCSPWSLLYHSETGWKFILLQNRDRKKPSPFFSPTVLCSLNEIPVRSDRPKSWCLLLARWKGERDPAQTALKVVEVNATSTGTAGPRHCGCLVKHSSISSNWSWSQLCPGQCSPAQPSFMSTFLLRTLQFTRQPHCFWHPPTSFLDGTSTIVSCSQDEQTLIWSVSFGGMEMWGTGRTRQAVIMKNIIRQEGKKESNPAV